MLLRYYDRVGVEADFDPNTGDLRLRPSLDFRQLLRDAEGVFTILAGVVLVLAPTSAGVTLRVSSRSSPLNGLLVEVIGDQAHRVLQIGWPTGEVDRLAYVVSGWIDADPTPGVEREDFDFGLYLQNVRNDPARQRRMCGISDD